MSHKAALVSSFALAIVAAFMIATQWNTLISRGSPAATTVEAEAAASTSTVPPQTDVPLADNGLIARTGMSLDVPEPTATDPAPTSTADTSTYEDDEDDDQYEDDDDEYEDDDHDDDDGEHEEDDDEHESDDD